MATGELECRFTVPLPPADLSPNRTRNVHWARKSEAVSTYKAQCKYAGIEAWGFNFGPFKRRISFTWCLKDTKNPNRAAFYHPTDPDNSLSSLKACIDGLVEAGVLYADTWDFLEIGEIKADKLRGPFVEITIEAAEAAREATA